MLRHQTIEVKNERNFSKKVTELFGLIELKQVILKLETKVVIKQQTLKISNYIIFCRN